MANHRHHCWNVDIEMQQWAHITDCEHGLQQNRKAKRLYAVRILIQVYLVYSSVLRIDYVFQFGEALFCCTASIQRPILLVVSHLSKFWDPVEQKINQDPYTWISQMTMLNKNMCLDCLAKMIRRGPNMSKSMWTSTVPKHICHFITCVADRAPWPWKTYQPSTTAVASDGLEGFKGASLRQKLRGWWAP